MLICIVCCNHFNVYTLLGQVLLRKKELSQSYYGNSYHTLYLFIYLLLFLQFRHNLLFQIMGTILYITWCSMGYDKLGYKTSGVFVLT